VGSWCSGRRRDASERLGPKIAYVFDEAVNIYNDERVKWAIAWRYNYVMEPSAIRRWSIPYTLRWLLTMDMASRPIFKPRHDFVAHRRFW
jgi:hypothetical protein